MILDFYSFPLPQNLAQAFKDAESCISAKRAFSLGFIDIRHGWGRVVMGNDMLQAYYDDGYRRGYRNLNTIEM
jgi:hypothetical protein